jgi:secondary thiamine-phosphate synthase enzyme
MRTGARRSASVAWSPPNPPPIMTTCCGPSIVALASASPTVPSVLHKMSLAVRQGTKYRDFHHLDQAMKSHTEYLTFNIPARMDFRNITPQVENIVTRSGVKEGLCLVNAMHITASVFINDDEPGLHEDYKKWLEQLAPFDASPARYAHNRTGEDNADAHHKRQIMGREVVVAITKGKLDFGPWEQIFYGEFDGRRPKKVLVKLIGE